jgi:exonuclease VII small subunit
MPLFTPLKRLSLSTSIGDGLTSRTDDVVATCKALKKIGYAAGEEERGYIDRDLDSSIRTYQRDNNLKEDGILHPGGPTERALNISLFDAAEGDGGDEQAPDTPPEEETPAPHAPPEKPEPPQPPQHPGDKDPDETPPDDGDDDDKNCEGALQEFVNAGGALKVAEDQLQIAEQELATAKTQLADLETRLAKKKEQRGKQSKQGGRIGNIVGTGLGFIAGQSPIEKPIKLLPPGLQPDFGTIGGFAGEQAGEIAGEQIPEAIDNMTEAESVEELQEAIQKINEKIASIKEKLPELRKKLDDAQIRYEDAEAAYKECLASG